MDSESVCYVALCFQTRVSAIIVTLATNIDLQMASRAGTKENHWPQSWVHSTFSALDPCSLRSEVLTALGEKGPGSLEGVIIQVSGSNEIILSNEAATSALPLSLNFHCWRIPSQVEN